MTPEDIEAALRLNRYLASRYGDQHREDMISVGHETIAKQLDAIAKKLSTFDGSKAKFVTFISPWLRRDMRRAYIDLQVGVHIPHDASDYDELTQGIKKLEVDSLPINPLELTIAPASNDDTEIREALALMEPHVRQVGAMIFLKGESVASSSRLLRMKRGHIHGIMLEALRQLKEIVETGKLSPAPELPESYCAVRGGVPKTIGELLMRYNEGLRLCDIADLLKCRPQAIFQTLNRRNDCFRSTGTGRARRYYFVKMPEEKPKKLPKERRVTFATKLHSFLSGHKGGLRIRDIQKQLNLSSAYVHSALKRNPKLFGNAGKAYVAL